MSTVDLGARPKSPGVLVPVRFRRLGGRVLLTNPWGDWLFLDEDDHARLVRGEAPPNGPVHDALAAKNFLRAEVDLQAQAERMQRKRGFLDRGPSLHIFVVTLRCNETSVHGPARGVETEGVDTDMTPETAEMAVDLALQTTSPSVNIELRGGEPLLNFPVVKHIIEYAQLKNRAYGKQLELTMVSNLALMDEEKLAFFVQQKVRICSHLDGPEALHLRQRVLAGGNSYRESVRWIERVNEAYVELGLDPLVYRVEARLVMTRESLRHPREIVDTYVALGCREIALRPVDPFGLAARTQEDIARDCVAFLDFYRTAVDHMLSLDAKGESVRERYAAAFLTKILLDEDPGTLDLRSPSASAIGALAYNYDGGVFTSDAGCALHELGDSAFRIGDVATSTYRQLMTHPTVRALIVASIREVQPGCVACAFAPYCGVSPEHSYRTQGSIFGRMRESALCAVHMGIQDYVFGKLVEGDAATLEILRGWTVVRAETHFLHASSAS